MADQLKFKVQLPALATPHDVKTRELTVKVGDGEPSVLTFDPSAVETDELSGDQDSTVSLSLVDIDDAGNRSQPSEFSGTLVDTFPPAQPGALGINITGEEEGG